MPVDTKARGEASAAARLGIDVHDYRQLRALGYRWCSFHRQWQGVDQFRSAALRGSRSYCAEADRAKQRARTKAKQEGRKP